MTRKKDQEDNYFIVAPGIWAGTPCRYSSLKKAVEEFIAGTPFDRIHGSYGKKLPKILALTRELSLEDLAIEDNTISANSSTDSLSRNQPFYLIRTYIFHNEEECKGYDVIKCKDVSELQIEANKNLPKVEKLRNILTRGLELKLKTDDKTNKS